MKKIVFLLLAMGAFHQALVQAYAEESQVNISPIVQVISYYDIYGKYPQMMGW